jgi:plastocyanin
MTSHLKVDLGAASSLWHPYIVALGIAFICPPLGAQDNGVQHPNVIRGTVTILDDRGVELEDRSNVVVFVDGLGEQQTGEPAAAVVSQRDRRFRPRVLPLVRGTVVEFPNDDGIFHNVFSVSRVKTFDLGIYPKGESRSVTFDQPGLVKVYCNIHPDMISTVLVLNNPLFDTTDPTGAFEIDHVPNGEVTLRVWSEFSDEITRRVMISGGRSVEESFVIQETRRITEHNNKFGRPYRDKY